MTSSAPLAERLLAQLHAAAPGSFAAHTPAELYDLETARRLSIAERLTRLDDILRLVETQRIIETPSQRIRHRDLRM
jgi:hypothetical protein